MERQRISAPGLGLADLKLVSTEATFSAQSFLFYLAGITVRAMEPLVQIRNLTKTYHQGEIEVHALKQINLDLRAGEFLALMGPSGSGKSTLLHIIAGIDRATEGQCIVQGVDVGQLNETELALWRRQHVGFVFQTFNLIPVLTAYENVELPLLLTSLSARERRQHVHAALELVGLADRMRHLPRQLSGGQEQRVAIRSEEHTSELQSP